MKRFIRIAGAIAALITALLVFGSPSTTFAEAPHAAAANQQLSTKGTTKPTGEAPSCTASWYTIAGANPTPLMAITHLEDVAAAGPNDIWAVGYASGGGSPIPLIEHWNGSAWSFAANPAPTGSMFYGVTAITSNDVWAVGSTSSGTSITMHWNGTAWSVVASPNPDPVSKLQSVAAAGPSDVWAVGAIGNGAATLILHWNGTTWTAVTNPSTFRPEFMSIAAIGPQSVWAVGNHGGTSARAPLTEYYGCPPPTPTPTQTSTPTQTTTPTTTRTATATATCNPLAPITRSGSITNSDPEKHIVISTIAGTCNVNPCQGDFGNFDFHYDGYQFTNPSSSPVCITVSYNQGCMSSSAYLGSIDPAHACTNFLGASGPGTSYSFTVPGNATF